MSWIVETLLRNRGKIRSNIDITSDEYSDLLMVESAVTSLYKAGAITDDDIDLMDALADGGSLKDVGAILNKAGETVGRKVGYLCNLIAYKLGGNFTDDGYLQEMAETHKLSVDDVEILRSHMGSKYKHTISRNVDKKQESS